MKSEISFDKSALESIKVTKNVLLACLHKREQYRYLMEALHALHQKVNGSVKICVVHKECIQEVCPEYGVGGVPTFLLLNKGKEIDRLLGVVDESRLTAFIQKYLGAAKIQDE